MSESARSQGKIVRMPTGVSVFGPFRFERRSGRLSRGDAEIHLTPRAANVLRCLIAHSGEVVAKDQLFAEVWKEVNVTDDALLQVVSAVRKALGDDPRRPQYVQTVTGEGYRFIAELQEAGATPVLAQAGASAVPTGAEAGVGSVPAAAGMPAPAGGGATAVAPATSAWGGRTVAIGVALVAAVFVAWGFWSGTFERWSTRPGGGSERRSIAVLPFVNTSDDPANEYFSDGLAEELVSVLGRIDGLRVAARTSSFAFKEQPTDIREIARRLDVATILEGSARKEGNQVRIVVTLVDAADGFELWTAVYERQLEGVDDVFAIQRDIAEQVAEALMIPLLGDTVARLAEATTDNLEAYEAYLEGNFFLARYSGDGFRVAARNFERAIALDESFALAWVGLADAYLMQNRYGILPLQEALAEAEPAIATAMALDGQLGAAHAMLGLVRQRRSDFDGAEAAYLRAIELDPDSARTYQLYWWMLFNREGDTERTRRLADKALASDPLSPAQNENFGWALFEAGLLDEARAYFEKSIELEPAYSFGHSAIGAYHQTLGHIDQAIASFEKAVELSPETGLFRQNLGEAYAAAGRTDEAFEELVALLDIRGEEGGRYADIAELYWFTLGQLDEAVGWYQRAIEREPDNPRLAALLGQLYLDVNDEASAASWIDAAGALDPDNRWVQVARLNLYMHRGEYAEHRDFARRLAESINVGGYLAQFARPYSEYDPLGYFGVLAGAPTEALIFPPRASAKLLDADPVIDRLNVDAAIDLAAVLEHTGDDGRAELLLNKALAFIESQPDSLRRTRYREQPAEIYALQGRVPEALAALRLAIDQGWRRGWWRLRHKPHYAVLRPEAAFQAMMAELADEAERTRRQLGEGR